MGIQTYGSGSLYCNAANRTKTRQKKILKTLISIITARTNVEKKLIISLYRLCMAIFLLSTHNPVFTQVVQTLPIKSLNGPNGFALDKSGVLYIANEPGKQVVRIVHDSIAEKVLDADSPCGLDFDDEDNLYVINFFSGIVLRKHNGSVDTFARGLDKPADIKCDKKGNLYISEYEKGSIKKITKDGRLTEVASGFRNPFGLCLDGDGNLYVASNATGEIYKIDTAGTVSFFSKIPGSAAYIAISKNTGKLYVACFTCNTIYLVTKDGKTESLTGDTGAGYKDGSLASALFQGPNSIVISNEGDLYISEFTANRVRKITGVEK